MAPTHIDMTPTGPVEGTIRPPGSKSITNRALLCAAMAHGTSLLHDILDSEDSRLMISALEQLGIHFQVDFIQRQAQVKGCGGVVSSRQAELFVGNSGTTMRFLAALLSTQHGRFTLDGVPRMRERPIGPLVQAIRQLGVDVSASKDDRFPPITIFSEGWKASRVVIDADVSSQFLSGLLLAAPYAAQTTRISVSGSLVSEPYVQMTVGVMHQFGARVTVDGAAFAVDPRYPYQARVYQIEPDASAASYFWAAAAITGGRVTVAGISRNSLQGDVEFCKCLASMGCQVIYADDSITVVGPQDGVLQGIDLDMNAISDTVPTLAVLALAAEGPTTIRNVAHIRHKESDRIGDLARELCKLGADVQEQQGGMRITPGSLNPAEIETYQDHRMAMAFAIAGLKFAGVRIKNPGCTSKTYPNFFVDLAKLTGKSAS